MFGKVLFFYLFLFMSFFSFSQTVVPLYQGEIPNSKVDKSIKETSETKNNILIINNVTEPSLSVYLPTKEKANGSAVIICPGGGYWVLAASHEGTDVAKKLNEIGVAAFVLKYRLPDEKIMKIPEIGPLQDAQKAIQMVREKAKEYNINTNRIGIMGFSAGGHLASTAGTHFQKSYIDNTKNINLRPDFMILIYPVISSDTNIAHKGSHEKLLGKNASVAKYKEYSNELHVNDKTPPTFLVHASDDEGVKSANSIVFYEALRKFKIPVEMHIYQGGGHGFGMNNPTTKDQWMERLKNWMDSNGWLKK